MIASTPDPGVTVLRVNGDDDAVLAPRLRSNLASAVASDKPVVVDLSGAKSIDTSVVRVLLDGLAESEQRERVLVLLLPDDAASPVHRLFHSTGLAQLLPVVSSWDEALGRAGR